MPDKVVVSKPLSCIEECSESIEDSACANQHQKRSRGVVPKEREEEDNHPAHNQVDDQTYRRNGTPRQRFVEDAKQHHNPLNYND